MTRHGLSVIPPAKPGLRDRITLALIVIFRGRCRLPLVRQRPVSTADHDRFALMAITYLHRQCSALGTSRHRN